MHILKFITGSMMITLVAMPAAAEVTATDKIVDRFMELNLDPEESVGVDFSEYFTMVEQRAIDRFEAMDSDDDGEVTAEEYREFWRVQKAQYYRLKR